MSESTFDKLTKDYEKAIEDLQASCKHDEVSDWIQQYYAVGHSTNFRVKSCINCHIVVNRKTNCIRCRIEIVDDCIISGDGAPGTVIGCYYCKTCFDDLNMS